MPTKNSLGKENRMLKIWIFMLGPQESMRSASHFMNHKDSTYRTTLVYVLIAIASRAQTRDNSRVLGWGVGVHGRTRR